jgi:hypothetical protein
VSPTRGVALTDLQSSLTVNKRLSLSPSLSLSLTHTPRRRDVFGLFDAMAPATVSLPGRPETRKVARRVCGSPPDTTSSPLYACVPCEPCGVETDTLPQSAPDLSCAPVAPKSWHGVADPRKVAWTGSAGVVTTQRRRSFPPWGTHGPGGVRFPYFFSLGWQVTRVSPYVRGPFPSKEIRRISERDDPGPPVVPGGLGIGLGSRTPERAGR